jgi:small subunit ribosomal protein S3|uniref:Small ribosomal subunit protein uS3 n=1 Tax=candidate division WOR-3 bacterium TaxID=2052148 RepID=A0A7C3UP66_UNCW3
MGQKTHPLGFRLGITKDWKSQWFADKKEYRENLLEDIKIRKYIENRKYTDAKDPQKAVDPMISDIEILRVGNKLTIIIHTARPGVIFGREKETLNSLLAELRALTKKEVDIHIEAERVPELNARLVARSIVEQILKRVAYRRAMKKAIASALRLGAKGIKIQVSGRLAGAEIARSEWRKAGSIPLQTIRANIDYAVDVAKTVYGTIGVKVWIYKGEVGEEKGS